MESVTKILANIVNKKKTTNITKFRLSFKSLSMIEYVANRSFINDGIYY